MHDTGSKTRMFDCDGSQIPEEVRVARGLRPLDRSHIAGHQVDQRVFNLHNRLLEDTKKMKGRPSTRAAKRSLRADPLCFNGSKRRGLVSLGAAMEVCQG